MMPVSQILWFPVLLLLCCSYETTGVALHKRMSDEYAAVFSGASQTVSLEALSGKVMLWTGYPHTTDEGKEWGNEQIRQVKRGQTYYAADKKSYGHVPVLVAWDESGSVVAACVDDIRKPNSNGKVTWQDNTVTLTMHGCSDYRTWKLAAGTDFWNGLRQYALYMQAEHGLATRQAPDFSLKPWWSTYHYEEKFKSHDIRKRMQTLFKQLDIGTVQIDSGGVGEEGWGMELDGVNARTLGSVDSFEHLVSDLQFNGQRTVVWASLLAQWKGDPGASSGIYQPAGYSPITGKRGDDYLLKPNEEAQEYLDSVIERLQSWGVAGVKADDVSEPTSAAGDDEQRKWMEMNHSVAKNNKEFSYHRCSCGMMQSFHNNIAGQNAIITSDFMGLSQLRHRIKALNALNLGGAALLGDYIELNSNSESDGNRHRVEQTELYTHLPKGVIETVVGLGAVLQTKCAADVAPDRYTEWFQKYSEWKLSDSQNVEWVNHPYYAWAEEELYELRKDNKTVTTTFQDNHFISTVRE